MEQLTNPSPENTDFFAYYTNVEFCVKKNLDSCDISTDI